MSDTKPKRTVLRAEPQPSGEVLAEIESVEDAGIRRWMELVEDPEEPGDMIDVEKEDRSGCDFAGMSVEALGEWLVAMMPGFVHGYSEGPLPDNPTDTQPGGDARIAVLRRRLRRKENLHHPADRKLRHGPKDT